MHRMGHAAIGNLPGVTVTRKQVHRKSYEVKESSYTTCTIKEKKEK